MSAYKKQPIDVMWLTDDKLCFDTDLAEFLEEESFSVDPDTIMTIEEFIDFWECVELWWKDLQSE